MKSIKVSEEQVLFFRATRGHLAGPGAANLASAARAMLGAQSQQLPPALLALSMRTIGRPSAAEVKQAIFSDSRSLVRCWGQRDTIHIYDAAFHYRKVIAARSLWSSGGRGGAMPSESALQKTLAQIAKLQRPVTRADLMGSVPTTYLKAVTELAQKSGLEPKRFAAGRLLWTLTHQGHLLISEKIGAEQTYTLRETWFPKLKWPDHDSREAAIELMQDYLRVHGAASEHDIAHFFNAKVTLVREWIHSIEDKLTSVSCGPRENLLILSEDAGSLRKNPPTATKSWPLRLLPTWEAMLMGHADKSWTVPDESERKLIWRKAAMVSPVVLDRGRIVATWKYKATRKKVTVEVQPLSLWRKGKHQKAVQAEAQSLAAHLDVQDVDVKAV